MIVNKTRLCLNFNFPFLKDEFLADDPLPHVPDVIDDCLKVRRRIVGFGNENIVADTSRSRGI